MRTLVLTMRMICLLLIGFMIDHTLYAARLTGNNNVKVTSSSQWSNWAAERIIDSNPRNDADNCQCCSTTHRQLNPWYQLDFGKHYRVRRVYIKGRHETKYSQHFQNLQIFFESINAGLKNVEKTEAHPVYVTDYSLNVSKTTQFVSIMLRNVTRHFTVCEIEVYGDCADGEYGDTCNNVCHCNGDPCNKTTGVCPSGECLPGYHGQQCDKVCSDGTYGPGCKETCGNCLGHNIVCDKMTGKCPSSCSAGYKGDQCKTECIAGTYGLSCTRKCGKCLDNKPCNVTTGSCEHGCSEGYQDLRCDRECVNGRYGINCSKTCGNCTIGETCAFTNGVCPNGCRAGYKGRKCKTECDNGTYGENCMKTCGFCKKGEICKKTNGYCSNGCAPGYINDFCNETCNDGNYGDGCLQECGHCDSKKACNKTDGTCTYGCDYGYQRPLCKKECEDGTFGKNCANRCGQCLNSTTCNKENGTCSACSTGYTGHGCFQQLTGNGADESPSPLMFLGVAGGLLILVLVIVAAVIVSKRRHSPQPVKENTEQLSVVALERKEEVQSEQINITASKVPDKKSIVTTLKAVEINANDNGDYGSFITTKKTLKVCQLWDYIFQKKKNGCALFHQEFNLLKVGLHHPHDVALLKENKPKNRYRGLYAYDHSRVQLAAEENESEYINASFIDGSKVKKFIASQGPTSAMRDDFWRMVWQQGTQRIIMVTNLIEMGSDKCLIYWPETKDENVNYGNMSIQLQSTVAEPDFVIRYLDVRKNSEPWRQVTQYHFRAWPDKDVPDSTWSLVKFWLAAMNNVDDIEGPIVVHCSAGIGRTGTFIALDNAFHKAQSDGTLNVLDTVASIRDQRTNMVQTKEQYVFLHEAVADALLFGTHNIWSSQFEDVYKYLTDENFKGIKTQYKLIVESVADRERVIQDGIAENEVEYSNVFIQKSTPSSNHASEEFVPRLQNMEDVHSLGAVLLPNYEEKNTFIITKSPTDSTIAGCWSIIDQQNVKTVIMLTDPSATNCGMCSNLGINDKTIRNKHKVVLTEEMKSDLFKESIFTYDSNEGPTTLHQFEFTNWSTQHTVLPESRFMIHFLEQVLDWQQRLTSEQPILVHCSNGYARSGLVCVLLNELEHMKRDQGHINIVQSVKLMKERNENIIPSFDQYMYIHDVILSTFKKEDIYANC